MYPSRHKLLAVLMTTLPAIRLAPRVTVGLLLSYTWVNKAGSVQTDKAIRLYMKRHGDTVQGHKTWIIRKDTTGPKPDVAAVSPGAAPVVTRDEGGYSDRNRVIKQCTGRVVAVANKAKVPLIIMNAGAAAITTKSPYVTRVSFTMWHAGYPMGEYAAKQMGFKRVITMFANYAPGKDSNNAFKTGFIGVGGKVIDEIPLPFPKMPDHTPFLQRVKDAEPDALYAFVPAGKWATALMKTFGDLGLKEAGIALIGPGDIIDDVELANMGDVPLGLVNAHHYSAAHDSPENKAFVAAWKQSTGPIPHPTSWQCRVGLPDGARARWRCPVSVAACRRQPGDYRCGDVPPHPFTARRRGARPGTRTLLRSPASLGNGHSACLAAQSPAP
ncbi:hypothetical protein NKDENANG_04055 [Candidatus Entotheonellaceae bacterium PAL068K]